MVFLYLKLGGVSLQFFRSPFVTTGVVILYCRMSSIDMFSAFVELDPHLGKWIELKGDIYI